VEIFHNFDIPLLSLRRVKIRETLLYWYLKVLMDRYWILSVQIWFNRARGLSLFRICILSLWKEYDASCFPSSFSHFLFLSCCTHLWTIKVKKIDRRNKKKVTQYNSFTFLEITAALESSITDVWISKHDKEKNVSLVMYRIDK